MTDLKTLRPADLKVEEPVWEGKWKNLYFDINGRTFRGTDVFDTEEDAYLAKIEADNNQNPYGDTMDGILHDAMISHCIQIPWKEKD